jgi:hypothetical protein
MRTTLAVALVALTSAGPARADIPPPAGFKRVTVDHKIETTKEFADYAFFTVIGFEQVTAVKLDTKKAYTIEGKNRGGAFQFCELVAVPKDAAKGYATEKDFHAALAKGKVTGQIKAKEDFSSLTTLKATDARSSVTVTHKLEKVSAKDGIVFAEGKKGGGKPEEEELSGRPRGGLVVAGLAAAAGLVLGGLWLAGRSRRPAK